LPGSTINTVFITKWEFLMVGPHGRRIVVGVDGSAESVAALMWACREASLRDASVDAVLVLEAACHQVANYAVPRPARADGHGSWGAARDVLWRAVTHASGRFPGVTVQAEIAEGLAARVLLDRAEGADMMVLGRSRPSDDQHRAAGPVVRACLRGAPCPVAAIGLADVLDEDIEAAVLANGDHVPEAWTLAAR
jgi:nucleotide-binding universal stress UspA family protein